MQTTHARFHPGALHRAGMFLAIATVALVLTTCSNPMLSTLQSVVEIAQRPRASIDFATGAGLASDTVITVTFSETMDPATLTLGGTLAEHASVSWSEGTPIDGAGSVPNVILTIAPESTWPLGSGKGLTLDCQDTDTYELETLEVAYGVLNGIVYVHGENGSDSNPGTIDRPKKSIPDGVSAAQRVYDTAEGRVAGGTYQTTSAVTVSDDISLYGGYNPDNWNERDPATYETVWSDLAYGTHETLYYAAGVGAVTLDGFRIEAGNGEDSDGTAAIFVSSASPIIRNNTIVAGVAGRAYGITASAGSFQISNNTFVTNSMVGISHPIYASESTVTISDNTITGEMITEFFGIALEDCTAVVERNRVNAGQPTSHAQCIYVDGGSATIRNNVLTGGNMISSDVIGQYGLFLNDCTVTVHSNTIDGGGGSSSDGIMATGIMLFYQVTSTIENNLIFTRGGADADLFTGVWQVDAASFPRAFNNNVMFDCPDGNYYDEVNNDMYALGIPNNLAALESFINGSGGSAAANAFEISGGLTTAPEYRPQAGSPDSIKTGGKTLSGFTDDIDGVTRTAPWSVGAYEY